MPLRTRTGLVAAITAALAVAACHADSHSVLPSPAALASRPMSASVTVGEGPGIGPEIVFAKDGAMLESSSLTLAPRAIGVLRWSALERALVEVGAIELVLPAGVEASVADGNTWRAGLVSHVGDEGALLLALENHGATPVTLTPALVATIPATFPAWSTTTHHATPGLGEPSGIDYDYKRHTLWVVDDGAGVDTGRLGRVNPVTGDVEVSATLGGDLEAVRWVPALDLLLISNELADELWIVEPDTLAKLAVAPLVLATNVTPFTVGGDGFEGLAVTGVHARTIDFVVANQNDPAALYRGTLTLPATITGSIPATLTTFTAQPPVNLSEVTMDWGSRRLFNLHGYQLPNRLVLLDSALNETAVEFQAPDLGDEGACLAPDGSLWLANDLGGITNQR